MGEQYFRGKQLDKNWEKMLECFTKAAKMNGWWVKEEKLVGIAEAQYNLGYCYHHGCGIEANQESASYWYSKARENGFIWENN